MSAPSILLTPVIVPIFSFGCVRETILNKVLYFLIENSYHLSLDLVIRDLIVSLIYLLKALAMFHVCPQLMFEMERITNLSWFILEFHEQNLIEELFLFDLHPSFLLHPLQLLCYLQMVSLLELAILSFTLQFLLN